MAMNDVPSLAVAAKRPVGRPRRLTLDAIIAAACDLGLEKIEMAALAERLNTGVGTLYSYVRGREHLLGLVAEQLMCRNGMEDRGQDWRTLLREHAAMASAVFAARPRLMEHLLAGESGPQGHAYSRRLVEMLVSRGFARGTAIDLYIEVTQIVLGAALCAQRLRALAASAPADAMLRDAPASIGDHRATLERLIRDVDAGGGVSRRKERTQ